LRDLPERLDTKNGTGHAAIMPPVPTDNPVRADLFDDLADEVSALADLLLERPDVWDGSGGRWPASSAGSYRSFEK
jgi:hypothetical protein